MTVIEARIALRKSLGAMSRGKSVAAACGYKSVWSEEPLQDVVISPNGFRFTDKGQHTGGWLTLSQIGDSFELSRGFSFEDLPYLAVRKCGKQFGIVRAGTKDWFGNGISVWGHISNAQLFVDAVNVLIFEYGGGDPAKEAAEFEEFKARARSWRELRVKPELPEDARREKVLAEEAIREKSIVAAISHYQAGLKLTPLWPQAHFNVALLHAESGDYFDAIRHMRRYLELVPDAADAQAARDQSIVWEHKAQQRKQRAPLTAPN